MNKKTFNECIQKIRSVAFALDKLETRGKENLDILLGSIQALENVSSKLIEERMELEESIKAPEITLVAEESKPE